MQAHRVRALLALMPQAWQLEGCVNEVEASTGNFYFHFNMEEEIQSMDVTTGSLGSKCQTDFPSKMVFSVFIEGVPDHYNKEETVKGIGEKLGESITLDVKHAKVRVLVECGKLLQFETRVQFSATGDEFVVTFKYDKLKNLCFICNRMTRDGKRCLDLEKERARVAKHGYKDMNPR